MSPHFPPLGSPPEPPAKGPPAGASDADLSPYRSRPPDGGPGSGSALTPLLRFGPWDWSGTFGSALGGEGRPSGRLISNEVFQQTEDIPNQKGASNLLWLWGQFVDHDLSLTEAHGDGEPAPIEVPLGDPFFDPEGAGTAAIGFSRVAPIEGTGETGPRQYPNEITAFLDASNVYGSSAAGLARLRDEGGKIKLDEADLIVFHEAEAPYAGDKRAGENVALTSMHALFAREHNRLVDEFAAADPSLTPDELFGRARAHVEAILQAITYNEFLPMLLGETAIGGYRGHDPAVDPQVSVEFSTAVFRFGHTLLSPFIHRLAEDGSAAARPLALRDAFFRPDVLAETGVDPIFRGLAGTHAQAIDAKVIEDVRSFLFGAPGSSGFDLVAINIQRGRDLGVASYNDLREALGLDRAATFGDISSDAEVATALAAAYGEVDRVDAWVGGIVEDPLGDGMVGELFSTVMIDQFTRVRDGDPFWSEGRGFAGGELEALWSTTLSDVIRRNTGIEHLQDQALLHYERRGGSPGDDRIEGGKDRDLLLGFDGDDALDGRGGDDQLEGGGGDDLLLGGEGDDRLDGGEGDDRLFAGPGADEARGGEGDDAIDGRGGDDRLEGNRGDDRLTGSDGDDCLVGGKGDDLLLGGGGDDLLLGDGGDDRLRGGAGDDDVRGGAGDDLLKGGRGDDVLEGGEGRDSFVFRPHQKGSARIVDFDAEEDALVLRGEPRDDAVEAEQVGADIHIAFGKATIILEHALPEEGGSWDALLS